MRYEIQQEITDEDLTNNRLMFENYTPQEKAEYNGKIHQHIIQDLIFSGLPIEGIVVTLEMCLKDIKKAEYRAKKRVKDSV